VGNEVTSQTYFPAAYLILILGVIIFGFAMMTVRKEIWWFQKFNPEKLKQTRKHSTPQHPIPPQNLGGRTNG
jgi:hypothetical protein